MNFFVIFTAQEMGQELLINHLNKINTKFFVVNDKTKLKQLINKNDKIKILTIVRNPIIRNLSEFILFRLLLF